MGFFAAALILTQTVIGWYQPLEYFRIRTPDEYYTWNMELEGCTGYDVNLDDVEFYVVPWEAWYSNINGYVNGEYFPVETGQKARIYLAYPLMYQKWLVKHEIMHHHLNVPGHPEPPFGDCEYR